MKNRFITSLWAFAALIILPGLVSAQATGPEVKGYTDRNGVPLPTGGITMTQKSDGNTTTVTITGLHAYGEANLNAADGAAAREAVYATNPAYFDGGTVYALRHGDDWRGGRTASSVKLDEDKGIAVLAKGPVGKDQVTLTFPSLKAAKDFACQTTTFMIVKKDGKRAWIGHSGYATSNSAGSIGDYLFLAQDDKRFPGTGFCYDKAGALVPLTTAYQGSTLRQSLAKRVQKPAGVDEDAKKVAAAKKPQDD